MGTPAGGDWERLLKEPLGDQLREERVPLIEGFPDEDNSLPTTTDNFTLSVSRFWPDNSVTKRSMS